MRRPFIFILLAMLPASPAMPKSITINARNWGPDSIAADQAMAQKAAEFIAMSQNAETVSWLAHYTYSGITDSTVWIDDWGQADPKPIRRAFIPSNPEAELPVSPIWCIISKAVDTVEVIVGEAEIHRALHAAPPDPKKGLVRKGKITTTYATFSTWQGGPRPTGVVALDASTTARLKKDIAELRADVDSKCKADKKLKRNNAWKAAKKEKAEREKIKKIPGKRTK